MFLLPVLLLAAVPFPAPPDPERDVQALAQVIDRHLADTWKGAQVAPAAPVSDAEFLRRVYLDLAGRIPSVAETRAFLKDQAPDKRKRLVEKLLRSPRYVMHFTHYWRGLLLPEATSSLQARFLGPTFDAWLGKQLSENAGYDQMVRNLLTTPVGSEGMRNLFRPGVGGDANAVAFYIAKEVRPENLAASVSRLFLGVRLECAQCHNHPFATWKRDQFWALAAFFAGMQRQGGGDFAPPGPELLDRREITIPGTERTVAAAFLDGRQPQWQDKASPRAVLASWITAADNPYFARAAVNRLWAYFFGAGLVEPVDDMVGGEQVCRHPELLDALARSFAAHQFDLKFLIRAITASQAYQLSSAGGNRAAADPQLFARMPLRGLTPEQLFDSVVQATGFQDPTPSLPPGLLVPGTMSSPRAEFLARFGNQTDRPAEFQMSILQALTLLNGKLVTEATSLERSETLAAVVDAPFLDTAGRIETLYLATLSRFPTPPERTRLVRYVESDPTPKAALADVFWALLNSGEFILNH